jgi:hypothetical protein
MGVQDIGASISAELSAEHSRQDRTGERFAPETPEIIDRKLSEIDALFRQLALVAEQISIAKSKEEGERLEGEAERITANVLAVTRNREGSGSDGGPCHQERVGRPPSLVVWFLGSGRTAAPVVGPHHGEAGAG